MKVGDVICVGLAWFVSATSLQLCRELIADFVAKSV